MVGGGGCDEDESAFPLLMYMAFAFSLDFGPRFSVIM